MKKLAIILILFTFSFSFAFAQDASSSATSSASSTKLSQLEQRNEKIRNYAAQTQERLNVIVGNLERMASRVETQIDKLASSTATSADLSAAQIKLADAKKKIEELKTSISNLTAKTEDIIKSKTPKTAFYAVREGIVKKILIAKIKVIHKELLDAVKLAKKEIVKTKAQNATSTQDTSDWKTYRNEEYGFQITLNNNRWKGYRVVKSSQVVSNDYYKNANIVDFAFAVPSTDKNYFGAKDGYATLFAIEIFPVEAWKAWEAWQKVRYIWGPQEYLASNNKYVFVYMPREDYPKDMTIEDFRFRLSSIVFKLIE